jgi:hypothetical protein
MTASNLKVSIQERKESLEKRQPTEQEKICARDTSDKGLITRT